VDETNKGHKWIISNQKLSGKGFLLISVLFLLKFRKDKVRKKFLDFMVHSFNNQIYPNIPFEAPYKIFLAFFGECGIDTKLQSLSILP